MANLLEVSLGVDQVGHHIGPLGRSLRLAIDAPKPPVGLDCSANAFSVHFDPLCKSSGASKSGTWG